MQRMDKISSIIKKKRYVLPILKEIQKEYGFLSEKNLKKASKILTIPLAKLYSTVTWSEVDSITFKSCAKVSGRKVNKIQVKINIPRKIIRINFLKS